MWKTAFTQPIPALLHLKTALPCSTMERDCVQVAVLSCLNDFKLWTPVVNKPQTFKPRKITEEKKNKKQSHSKDKRENRQEKKNQKKQKNPPPSLYNPSCFYGHCISPNHCVSPFHPSWFHPSLFFFVFPPNSTYFPRHSFSIRTHCVGPSTRAVRGSSWTFKKRYKPNQQIGKKTRPKLWGPLTSRARSKSKSTLGINQRWHQHSTKCGLNKQTNRDRC